MKQLNKTRSLGMRTLAVHGGQQPDVQTGAVATPITASSAFSYPDFDSGARRFSGEEPGYMYSRFANPTVTVFEQKLAGLEGAETSVACASGMAAISATLFALLVPGDEIIHVGTLYGGTEGVVRNLLPRYGIKPVHVTNVGELEAAFTKTPKSCWLRHRRTRVWTLPIWQKSHVYPKRQAQSAWSIIPLRRPT